MSFRSSVNLSGIRPELVVAMLVARERFFGLTVTSVMDGKHMIGSLHYVGCAFDFVHPLMGESYKVEALRHALGPQFDVVVESDHIHVEFQPDALF